MISDNSDFEGFVDENNTAVLTGIRKSGFPVSSIVTYARSGENLIVSTQGKSFKCTMFKNNPHASLCIFDRSFPPAFVSLECKVTIIRENVLEATQPIFDQAVRMGFSTPEDPSKYIAEQERVVLQFEPKRINGDLRFKGLKGS